MIDKSKGFVDFFFTGDGNGGIFVVISWDGIDSMSEELSMYNESGWVVVEVVPDDTSWNVVPQ